MEDSNDGSDEERLFYGTVREYTVSMSIAGAKVFVTNINNHKIVVFLLLYSLYQIILQMVHVVILTVLQLHNER
jgi:hypothetical protein